MVGTFAEFQETMTLALPDVKDRLDGVFGESKKTSTSHGLIVELAAIHEGLTANFNNYTADELEAALDSWVHPFPKPILINHDLKTDPLGRIMAAKMDKEKDGTVYTRLQIAVTDPTAMARVADKRYLTGSVGGKSKEAICSVCNMNWAEASTASLPCKHSRGKTYKGKLAFLDRKGLGFHEYSFVNAPADSLSIIRDSDESDEGANEWTRAARVFDLNMNQQEILEFEESENRSVFQGMRNKEATPMYLQLKGAFLTALSAEAAELGMSEESSEVTVPDNEDILALSEELSDDLKVVAGGPEAEAGEEDSSDTKDAGEENGDAETPASTDGADEPPAEAEGENAEDAEAEEKETPAEELRADENEDGQDSGGQEGSVEDSEEADRELDGERGLPTQNPTTPNHAQGQEIARAKHDPDVYSKPMMGDAGTYRRRGETEKVDKSRESEDLEENGEGTELNEAVTALERHVAELEEHESALLEENTRLKKALHRTLAERVVDGKIAMGLHGLEERDELLTEHMDRSASSLADNLRDLARMSYKRSTDPSALPTLEQRDIVPTKDRPNALEVVTVQEHEEDPLDPEEVFTDVLMGRRKLN